MAKTAPALPPRRTNGTDAATVAAAIDVIIPRRDACRDYLKVSPVTAWRRERDDPTWPPAIDMGHGRSGYRLSSIKRRLDSRPERVTAAKTATSAAAPAPAAAAAPTKPKGAPKSKRKPKAEPKSKVKKIAKPTAELPATIPA